MTCALSDICLGQAACSTSSSATAYSIKAEDYDRLPLFAVDQNNRVLNEFAFYCLKRLHKLQNFGSLKVTCNDINDVQAHFSQAYEPIDATATLPEIPETYFYSKELIAYLTAMLSTVPYAKTGDSSIIGLMDEEYTAVLHRLRGMTSKAFNDYLVRRMSAYIDRWPVDAKPAAAPAPAAADDTAAEDGGGGGEAAGDDDRILMMGSDDEAAPDPPASQPAGDCGQGAA